MTDTAPAETPTPSPPAAVQDPPSAPQGGELRRLMGRYSGPRDLDGQLRLAARLARARHALPEQYRDNDGDILALMQHAISLDIELPVAWDNLVFNVQGVGGMRARLMHALVLRAGHKLHPVHVSPTKVRMYLHRGDGRPSGGAQWTLVEATENGLLGKTKSPWPGYGEDMLWARCTSRTVRRWAPEVLLGFYEASELDDIPADEIGPADMSTAMVDVDGNPVPAPDVVDLLKDLDGASLEEIRERWQIAHQEGMLGAFAGVVDGLHMTVQELLLDRGTDAEAREQRSVGHIPKPAARAAARATAEQAQVEVQDLDLPAGEGAALPCGCSPADVLANGAHGPACADV